MTERVDLVIIASVDRDAFLQELAGREPHPRVRVIHLGPEEAPPAIALDNHCLSTVAIAGASQVDAAHAASAALTGARTDPAETRAPGRPRFG